MFDTTTSRFSEDGQGRKIVSVKVAAFDRKMADSDHSIGNDSDWLLKRKKFALSEMLFGVFAI